MAPRTLPGLGLTGFWALGEDGWKDDNDVNLLKSSVLIQSVVLSRVTALPGSPADGEIYIVPSGGDANKFAVRDNGAWFYITPGEGWLSYVLDEDAFIRFASGAWGLLTSTGSGLGDVTGPGSSVSGHLASFSGTTGKILQDSGMAIDTDGTLAANSDTRFATQKAVKTYADALIVANDAMVFKGVIDCSANPNYPAADSGHQYRVSVAGKIGGASGVNVEVGDMLLCLTDGTAAGNQATVGSAWSIIQTNLDGAVINTRSVLTATGLTGGGDLSANRTIALDLNALTEDTTPDADADFVVTYDASAAAHKKVKPKNMRPKESFIIAVSDESTAITTGTAKVTFRMPYGFALSAVRASLTTAQASGSTFTVDINEAGTTILSTKLTVDNTEKTSTTAATAAVISDASLADDAEMTIDIDQIGDGTAKGLKVYLIGSRT